MKKLLFREACTSLIIWLVGLIWISVVNIGAIAVMFSTTDMWKEYYSTIKSAVGVLFAGPGIGLDPNVVDIGNACVGKLFVMLAAALVIVNINFCVNWNRGFEEDGRTELLLALPVRRNALQIASIINLTLFNLITCVGVSLSFIVIGCKPLDTVILHLGLFLFCEMWLLIGLLMSAIFSVARTAKLAGIGLFLATYVIAALGWVVAITAQPNALEPDLPWYCWISPIHWIFEIQPFVNLSYTPLVIFGVFVVVLAAINYIVFARRDMSASLIQANSGAEYASPRLKSMFALRLRTSYITTLVWGLVLAGLGVAYGSMISQILDMIKGNEVIAELMKVNVDSGSQMQDDMTNSVVNGYLGYMLMFLFIVVAGFCISNVTMTLSRDENTGIYEMFFAKPISRLKYLCQMQSILVINLLIVGVLTIFGFTQGSANSLSTLNITDMIVAGAVSTILPLFFLGLAIFLHSISAKLVPLTWAYFAFSVVIAFFSDILKTPDWLNGLSIFQHFGKYPIVIGDSATQMNLAALIVFSVLTSAFYLVAFPLYRRRDLR